MGLERSNNLCIIFINRAERNSSAQVWNSVAMASFSTKWSEIWESPHGHVRLAFRGSLGALRYRWHKHTQLTDLFLPGGILLICSLFLWQSLALWQYLLSSWRMFSLLPDPGSKPPKMTGKHKVFLWVKWKLRAWYTQHKSTQTH